MPEGSQRAPALTLERRIGRSEAGASAMRPASQSSLSFVCQAHERAVARLKAEVGFRAEAEAAAARAVAAVATLEEEAHVAAERVAALEAEAARREQEMAAAAREAEVRSM